MDRQGDFKVGDLVKLTAYGKSIINNSPKLVGKYGIVVSINTDNYKFPIEVSWIGVTDDTLLATQFWYKEIRIVENV